MISEMILKAIILKKKVLMSGYANGVITVSK